MNFDPDNKIVKLCAEGMNQDGEEAARLFQQAWNEASSDLEKFITAHYVARVQPDVESKLIWDLRALEFAMNVGDEKLKSTFPSLYLNIGKCYEDLSDFRSAKENYETAMSYCVFLESDGYGNMIRAGVNAGLERVSHRVK